MSAGRRPARRPLAIAAAVPSLVLAASLACSTPGHAGATRDGGAPAAPPDSAFLFHARYVTADDGEHVVDLALGRATAGDVARLFPRMPARYEGRLRPCDRTGMRVDLGSAPEPVWVMNPPSSAYALFFDRSKTLVLIVSLDPVDDLAVNPAPDSLAARRDTAGGETTFERRGAVAACVELVLVYDEDPDAADEPPTPSSAAWRYTCVASRPGGGPH